MEKENQTNQLKIFKSKILIIKHFVLIFKEIKKIKQQKNKSFKISEIFLWKWFQSKFILLSEDEQDFFKKTFFDDNINPNWYLQYFSRSTFYKKRENLIIKLYKFLIEDDI
ncbi:hypothetical protein [Mycoplasmopsis cricetuli]|uniref:hypothetical protein n=1 Tax=Mycoplasmopsis cricetuli TaxID=171283 RepID=UPI000471F1CA|nr:hypothetical protein [Mycoplasmopsis cricetuli]